MLLMRFPFGREFGPDLVADRGPELAHRLRGLLEEDDALLHVPLVERAIRLRRSFVKKLDEPFFVVGTLLGAVRLQFLELRPLLLLALLDRRIGNVALFVEFLAGRILPRARLGALRLMQGAALLGNRFLRRPADGIAVGKGTPGR